MSAQKAEVRNNISISIYILVTYILGAAGAMIGVSSGNPLYIIIGSLGLIGGIAMMLRPALGLYVLIVVVYINLSSVIVNVHGGPSIIKVFLPFLLLVIAGRWILLRDRFGSIKHITPIMLLYGALIAFSLFIARDQQLTADGLEAYVKDAVMVFIIVLLLQRVSQLRMVLWCMIVAGTFLGTISVFQQLSGTFENNYWGFAQTGVEHIIGNITNYRIAGPITTNFYAMIMLAIVPLALDRLSAEKNIWLKMFAGSAAMICVLTVLFTFSRGGFIALSIAVAYWLYQRRINLKSLIVVMVLLAMALPFVPLNYTERISTMVEVLPFMGDEQPVAEVSLRGRLSEQIAAWRMFIDHPLFGVGYDNYDVYYLDYSEEIGLDQRREERQAHNLYLEVAAETGIIGILLFAALLTIVFRGLQNAKRVLEDTQQHEFAALVIALQASIIGYLASSMFLHAAFPRYFWLYVGIALALPNITRNELLYGRTVR